MGRKPTANFYLPAYKGSFLILYVLDQTLGFRGLPYISESRKTNTGEVFISLEFGQSMYAPKMLDIQGTNSKVFACSKKLFTYFLFAVSLFKNFQKTFL